MSQSPYERATRPSTRSQRERYGDPDEPELPIRIHTRRLYPTMSGSEILYCYWKISIWLDLAGSAYELFVPPEWRTLKSGLLTQWIHLLRDRPFEDIVLGQTHYRWALDKLIPVEQEVAYVPMPGEGGWPTDPVPMPFWHEPRPLVNYPHVSINRQHLLESLNLQNVTHYWKLTVTNTKNVKVNFWVPPEWKRLPEDQLALWKRSLSGRISRTIKLGGIKYTLQENTLIPEGQNPKTIEYNSRRCESNRVTSSLGYYHDDSSSTDTETSTDNQFQYQNENLNDPNQALLPPQDNEMPVLDLSLLRTLLPEPNPPRPLEPPTPHHSRETPKIRTILTIPRLVHRFHYHETDTPRNSLPAPSPQTTNTWSLSSTRSNAPYPPPREIYSHHRPYTPAQSTSQTAYEIAHADGEIQTILHTFTGQVNNPRPITPTYLEEFQALLNELSGQHHQT